MTLDLSPGPWRPGLAPALHVDLRPATLEGEPATPGLAGGNAGIAGTQTKAGSSIPLTPRYYRDREVDVQAAVVSVASLIYPELAYVSRLRGKVRARVYIARDGRVDSVEIVGAWPRRGVFDEAALEALRQLRYKPAEIASQPVPSQKVVEVNFDPYDESGRGN